MHASNPYGYLLINGKKPTLSELARLVGCHTNQLKKCLDILRTAGVFSETDQGVIYCRRMVRDAEYIAKQAQHGQRGGNPTLKGSNKAQDDQALKGSVNGQDVPTLKVLDTRSQNKKVTPPFGPPPSPDPTPVRPARAKPKARLPDDFTPNDAGQRAAKVAGIVDITAELTRFRDFHTARGSLMADWQAAWRTWAGNARRFAANGHHQPRKYSPGPRGAMEAMGLIGRDDDDIELFIPQPRFPQ